LFLGAVGFISFVSCDLGTNYMDTNRVDKKLDEDLDMERLTTITERCGKLMQYLFHLHVNGIVFILISIMESIPVRLSNPLPPLNSQCPQP